MLKTVCGDTEIKYPVSFREFFEERISRISPESTTKEAGEVDFTAFIALTESATWELQKAQAKAEKGKTGTEVRINPCFLCKRCVLNKETGIHRCEVISVPIPDSTEYDKCGFELDLDSLTLALTSAYIEGRDYGQA